MTNEKLDWKSCNHQWGMSKTLYYTDFHVAYGSIATCMICGAREFNDWTTTRTGGSFKILPPENFTEE